MDQAVQAFAEGQKSAFFGAGMRFSRFPPHHHPANETSVLPFYISKLRKGRLKADFAHVPGINPG
ncbi:hypothetical protein D3C74_492670 [compost metagenome]